jgi:integrase
MLSDTSLRNAKAKPKAYKLVDSGGLHLHVTPAGARLWRWRYEIGGKERLLSLGRYPDMSLADARAARDRARTALRAGGDPAAQKRAALTVAPERTFEAVARAWHGQQKPTWTEHHAKDVLRSLERDIFPALGKRDLAEITAPMVLDALRKIEARPAIETARRIRQRMSMVFVFAISSGLTETDPAAIVAGALKPVIKGRQPAVTDLDGAKEVLKDVESEIAFPITKLAMRFLALTAVRPGEVRGARWEEFSALDGAALWTIPAERMKMKRPHIVPLSARAVEVIEAARLMSGKGPLVFPSSRNAQRPLSGNALGYLLNRAGYHGRHVPHGWRATFSSVMNERFPADRAVIDLMLAHQPADKTEAAYNRAIHMERRRELAQAWADLLMEGAPPAEDLTHGRRRNSPQGGAG